MNAINLDVRFELVKYFKLWSDIMPLFLNDSEKQDYKYFLSLPEWLELGACLPSTIKLMRLGLNRTVAIEATKQLGTFKGDPMPLLINKGFSRLNPMFQRHIRNQGFKF